MQRLEEEIRKIVCTAVEADPKSFYYREPIVGFAAADDPLYEELSAKIGYPQIHPKEFLADAQGVAVYFIPFSRKIVDSVRKSKVISALWSDAYAETNTLLAEIGEKLVAALTAAGMKARGEPPTYTSASYDKVNLRANWAHKSSAVIAGIGTFGLNHLVVTKKGTAGRLGSIVTTARLTPTKRPDHPYCLFYKTGKCRFCVENCPTGALWVDGSFDRFRCNAYLDGKSLHKMEQGCGMCSAGPCAMKGF